MSFAVFDYDGKCVGEGNTREEAVAKVYETLDISECRKFRLVEYIRGDQDSQWIDIHPEEYCHPMGQSG